MSNPQNGSAELYQDALEPLPTPPIKKIDGKQGSRQPVEFVEIPIEWHFGELDVLVSMDERFLKGDSITPFTEDAFESLLSYENARLIYVQDAQKETVGYYISGTDDEDSNSYRLTSIVLMPEARRQGIGKLMIEDFISHAASLGKKQVELDVEKNNHGAQAFYAKQGFQYTSIKEDYYGMGRAV